MSKEAYVKIETAELLKEKGFGWKCNRYYDGEDYLFTTMPENWNDDTEMVSIPTYQMVCRWLREVHHIFVEISTHIDLNSNYIFSYAILDSTCRYVRRGCTDYSWKYEDTVEAALKYAVENLI